jgi:mycothiol synthase
VATTTARLHPDQRPELLELIRAVESVDGTPPLSEYKTMRLGGGLDVREHILLDESGSIVGYGQAAWHGANEAGGHWAIEVAADGGHREVADVLSLIDSVRLDLEGASATIWARSGYAGVAARAGGWQEQRLLLEMRRSLPIENLTTDLGDARITTFRVGVDEGAWLKVNNAVFAGHPENGDMTRLDLERRMAQQWFDPAGFLLAWIDQQLVGSCWTKLHENGVGEIYIIGVAPGWEGRGLGKGLVAVGLDHLGTVRHARQGMLFVEASNRRATQLYEQLGFQVKDRVSAYSHSPNV